MFHRYLPTNFFLLLLLGVPALFCGCDTATYPGSISQPAEKITEDIRFKISVDTDSGTRPLVTLPGKTRLPGTPQVMSRFRLMVRTPSMNKHYTRLLNDEDVKKGGVWDLAIGTGTYSVALEANDQQGDGIVQYTNRVEFEFKKVAPEILKGKDYSRLRLPEGFSRFWRNYNTELVPIEKAEQVLSKARQYEALDVHKAYYYTAIPTAKVKVALAYCKNGQTEKGMEILEEIGQKGYLLINVLEQSGFDAVRETDEFKRLFEIAKTETEAESAGPYLVFKAPFCQLDELLQLKTNPPLPAAATMAGSPTIIYTGHKFDERLLESFAEKKHQVIWIGNFKPKKNIPGVQVHVANLPARALTVDGTPMIWVADSKGNVVYNQRRDSFCDAREPLHVADYLNSKEKTP